MADDTTTEIDQAQLRQVCGHFATGVTVVTAADPEGPVGMAVNSFCSVSLEPPLVLFCAAKASTTWPRIEEAGVFAVNILAGDQEELSRAFASKDGERFRGVGYRAGASGSPILDEALAYLDCRIEAEHDAGDHVIVVGRVVDLEVARDTSPLVFFRGGYADLTR